MKDFRYIMMGTLDHPGDLPLKGEFFLQTEGEVDARGASAG